jgi:hypothetical protein
MFENVRPESGRSSIELTVEDILLEVMQLKLTPSHFCRRSKLIFVAVRGLTRGQGK